MKIRLNDVSKRVKAYIPFNKHLMVHFLHYFASFSISNYIILALNYIYFALLLLYLFTINQVNNKSNSAKMQKKTFFARKLSKNTLKALFAE